MATDEITVWAERLRAGDPRAAERLFACYAERLGHLARQNLSRKLAGRIDSEDVVQSVFRTFFRRNARGEFHIDSSAKNYTYAPDQLRLLTAIGLQAGMAIQNAKLYQQGLIAERLAAVGETTAALSHSIKNILQALRGGADVVEMGLRSSNVPQASKGWRIVERNLDKIYNLTLNLRSLPANETVVMKLNLIGQGQAPNLVAQSLMHVTVNANGLVTATVDNFRVSCPG